MTDTNTGYILTNKTEWTRFTRLVAEFINAPNLRKVRDSNTELGYRRPDLATIRRRFLTFFNTWQCESCHPPYYRDHIDTPEAQDPPPEKETEEEMDERKFIPRGIVNWFCTYNNDRGTLINKIFFNSTIVDKDLAFRVRSSCPKLGLILFLAHGHNVDECDFPLFWLPTLPSDTSYTVPEMTRMDIFERNLRRLVVDCEFTDNNLPLV